MTVLTFAVYSGASCEGPGAMMEHASRVLDEQDPEKVLINSSRENVFKADYSQAEKSCPQKIQIGRVLRSACEDLG